MNKYFTEKQIYAATLFGGPIPPGILLYKNFKRVGDDKKALWSVILTFVFTILLFYGLMQLPDSVTDRIPNLVFTSLYTFLVYIVYHKYLAHLINDKIIEKENKVSNWNVTGITVIGLVINLIIIFVLAISQPAFPGDKIIFGELKHEVFYEKSDVSLAQVKAVGEVLVEIGYFQDQVKASVRVEKNNRVLQLLIPIQKEFWDNQDLMNEFYRLKIGLSTALNEDIVIVFLHYDLSGKTLQKEI